MKYTIQYILLLLSVSWLAQAQLTNSKNYVVSRTYKQTGSDANDVGKVLIHVNYLDGIGRPSQSVTVGQSPAGADFVQPVEYDGYGRQQKNYLPYAVSGGNGGFQPGASGAQAGFYSANSAGLEASDLGNASSQTGFENAPLNRPLSQRAPGNKSANASISYGSNADGEVKLYTYTAGSITSPGNYAAGRLYRTKTIDENGKQTTEFTDINGLVICKKVGDEVLKTYYVYDDLNRLRAVLQPRFQESASTADFAFLYDYDARGRMISKQVPGAGVTKFVYDNYDRAALSQDANQLARGVWAFTKYDIHSRPVLTGEITSANNQAAWQGSLSSSTAHHEDKSGSGVGYSLGNTLPSVAEGNVLTVNFYDDYSFPKAANLAYSNVYGVASRGSVKGRPTGSRARMLTTTANFLTTAIYYDSEYRQIQTIRELDGLGSGAIERVSTRYKYDLAAVAEEQKTEQVISGATNSHLAVYTYDHADRLLSVKETVTAGSKTKTAYTLAQRYNTLGQLQSKWFHGYAANSTKYRRRTDYTNNIRGWQTYGKTVYKQTESGSDLPFYAYGLAYANGGNYTNGNISSMQWRGKDETDFTKGLEFTYDGVNRLKNAVKPQTATYTYTDTESGINYDLNGNILALNRSGASSDNLTYAYTGNRLTSINDASTASNTAVKAGGSSYNYDGNGNMLNDGNRNATLTYNYLNLPKTVVVGGKTLAYDYDAAGNKHKYVADTLTIKYAGIFEYDAANAVKRVTTSAGQVQFSKVLPSPASDTLRFDYTLKDHLGNVRVVFDEKGNILQKSDYYPFGLAISRDGSLPQNARNGVNRYLYNEKELQLGTGYLDYGARMYMPEIGRWGVLDGKADLQEMASPYAYSLNSPLNYVDKDGQLPIFINGRVSSNSERGNSSYWDAGLLATIKNSGIANPGGESHFVDGDRYATYSNGRNFIDQGDFASGINTPGQRHIAGYEMGKREFSTILGKLARDPESGKITEKIQIYTHSRGAAFGTGYVEALLELIEKNANQFADPKNVIDFVYNMAPHQSAFLDSPEGVNAYSFSHDRDKLSDKNMKGLKASFTSNEKKEGFFGAHSTTSFIQDTQAFLQTFIGSEGNSQNFVDVFVRKMKTQYNINVSVSQ